MYIKDTLSKLKKQLCNEDFEANEYYQAVEEVFESLSSVISTEHKKNKILDRLIVADQVFKFKVIWEDDSGETQINTGYRIQYNNSLGIAKGGLRFHPSVNEKILKFLAFEQTFKNSLTGLPMGGAKGGSDFNPKGRSDREIKNFCYAFASKLNLVIGSNKDVPAGDIGVGGRELGYIYGKIKELRGEHDMGVLSGKPLSMGGSLARKEATGYGAVYFLVNMLEQYGLINSSYFPEHSPSYVQELIKNQPLQGKTVSISGSGNVSIYASQKFIQLGGKVISMSDSSGTIHDPNGIDLEQIKDIKEVRKERLSLYKTDTSAYLDKESYDSGHHAIWNFHCDIAMPCATQNELNINDIRTLHKNNSEIIIVEGANMPTTKAALDYILNNNILFSPGKASNAGGVATSFLEMSQNASLEKWSFAKVEEKIEMIMHDIFKNSYNTAKKYGNERNLVMGSNIYSFERLVESMNNQGTIN